MEIRNCRACGRMFSYIEGGSFLCPACQAELEDKFQVAKKYIRENVGASIQEVAEAADVSVKQIEKWIRECVLRSGEQHHCYRRKRLLRAGGYAASAGYQHRGIFEASL